MSKIRPQQFRYKGRGEHSVRELEQLVEYFQELSIIFKEEIQAGTAKMSDLENKLEAAYEEIKQNDLGRGEE